MTSILYNDPLDPLVLILNYFNNINSNTINFIINVAILLVVTWSIIEVLFFLTLRYLVWPNLQTLRKTQPYGIITTTIITTTNTIHTTTNNIIIIIIRS